MKRPQLMRRPCARARSRRVVVRNVSVSTRCWSEGVDAIEYAPRRPRTPTPESRGDRGRTARAARVLRALPPGNHTTALDRSAWWPRTSRRLLGGPASSPSALPCRSREAARAAWAPPPPPAVLGVSRLRSRRPPRTGRPRRPRRPTRRRDCRRADELDGARRSPTRRRDDDDTAVARRTTPASASTSAPRRWAMGSPAQARPEQRSPSRGARAPAGAGGAQPLVEQRARGARASSASSDAAAVDVQRRGRLRRRASLSAPRRTSCRDSSRARRLAARARLAGRAAAPRRARGRPRPRAGAPQRARVPGARWLTVMSRFAMLALDLPPARRPTALLAARARPPDPARGRRRHAARSGRARLRSCAGSRAARMLTVGRPAAARARGAAAPRARRPRLGPGWAWAGTPSPQVRGSRTRYHTSRRLGASFRLGTRHDDTYTCAVPGSARARARLARCVRAARTSGASHGAQAHCIVPHRSNDGYRYAPPCRATSRPVAARPVASNSSSSTTPGSAAASVASRRGTAHRRFAAAAA